MLMQWTVRTGGPAVSRLPIVLMGALLACAVFAGEFAVRARSAGGEPHAEPVGAPPDPGLSLKTIRASLRRMPEAPPERRNLAAALRRLNGAEVPPGGFLDLGALLGPWIGDDYCFAPCAGQGPYVALFGAGAEGAAALCLAAARAAGLDVEAPALLALPLPAPVAPGTRLRNPTADAARIEAGWKAGRPVITVSATVPAPGTPVRFETPASDEVRLIAAVGDVACDPRAAPGIRRAPGALAPSHLARLLREADVVIANLETPLTDARVPTPVKCPHDLARGRQFVFRSAPELGISLLGALSVNVALLANNHIFDYGAEGIGDTHKALRRAGVQVAGPASDGKGAVSAAFTLGNHPYRVFSFVGSETLPPTAEAKLARAWVVDTRPEGFPAARAGVAELIAAARRRGETPIVGFHWGAEGVAEPTELQRELARAAAEAGAALILGHHPHRLQPIDTIGSCVVAYSLGNFVFAPMRPEQAASGVLVAAVTHGRVFAAGLVPVHIAADGIPQLLETLDFPEAEGMLADLGVGPH